MIHPYKALPDRSFWARAVAQDFVASELLLPVEPLIRTGEKVVSAGSCFASNLVPYLERSGLTYHRTEERHPAFASVAPENAGYDRFSAAYGNVYTARQLVQLLRRARGQWWPVEDRWHSDGVVHDPFRPALRYASRTDREFEALLEQHLECSLRAFAEADVFIFTLGLTEAWVSSVDGAVYPACPGTIAGQFDPARHLFMNFSAQDVADDLQVFIKELREVNPTVRFVLTVSPVPLVATATGDHVLAATVYSKSVLRVAAAMATETEPRVTYFPAYEIVTGPQAPHHYFEEDRRSVSKAGVDAVMQAFLHHCEVRDPLATSRASDPPAPVIRPLRSSLVEAECEEEMMARDDSI